MPFTFTEDQRKTLIQGLLDDVRSPDKRIGPKSAYNPVTTNTVP